jgi:Ca2+-binding EF-hand superfamily protein
MGYISTVSLANWINDNCGFKISPHEMNALQRRFDRHDKYRIRKDVFVSFVSPAPEEEEEEEEKQLEEA